MTHMANPMIYTGLTMILAGALLWCGDQMRNLTQALRENSSSVRELRLEARTRISTAKVSDKPKSEVQILTHLGRRSRRQRVVVGGNPEAALTKKLRGAQE